MIGANEFDPLEQRTHGLLRLTEAGSIQPPVRHPHACGRPLFGEEFFRSFGRHPARAAPFPDVVRGSGPPAVLDLGDLRVAVPSCGLRESLAAQARIEPNLPKLVGKMLPGLLRTG
ncbi:hypothetical protein GCM10010191_68600 [Actinomadura vinacea]|uniref:Uncharacterized protein n=1 Tax=Actinomadura vinacea TaxID=115336 RepID=A0ABP5X7D2_9ACTN